MKEEEGLDLAYRAWTLLANVGVREGGWKTQEPVWVTAVEKWRDDFHEALLTGKTRPKPITTALDGEQ